MKRQIITGTTVLAIIATSISYFTSNNVFATPYLVEQAKADVLDKVDYKDKQIEERLCSRLDRIENKIDKILLKN